MTVWCIWSILDAGKSKAVIAMSTENKGRSPFYPGQPVPAELFVGRQAQIDRIMTRGAEQVAAGKPVAIFVEGEYGIGKSSIAAYVQRKAEEERGLHAIYASLANAQSLDDVGGGVLRATVESGAFEPRRSERIREWLSKYIGEQTFFGVTVHAEALKRDGPDIAAGMLPFLRDVHGRLKDTGVTGVFLVLDEINGIAADPRFAHFIKGLVDTNAMSREPVPLLLALCGVEERRRVMIQNHRPVERIFDIVEIERLTAAEMASFFTKAFGSVGITVEDRAMPALTTYSAGLPKIMHLVGDAAFWRDDDGVISAGDALAAVIGAAEEVGQRYVDQQVYRALRSEAYHSILRKIGASGLDMTFRKADVAENLTQGERTKFDNFLQRMKKLDVLKPGETRGEYTFNSRMVQVYIWLNSQRAERKGDAGLVE